MDCPILYTSTIHVIVPFELGSGLEKNISGWFELQFRRVINLTKLISDEIKIYAKGLKGLVLQF